jgi:hypothetical protein
MNGYGVGIPEWEWLHNVLKLASIRPPYPFNESNLWLSIPERAHLGDIVLPCKQPPSERCAKAR